MYWAAYLASMPVTDESHVIRVLNPATGAVVGEVPVTGPQGVGLAVQRARRAQPSWAAIPLAERGRILASAAPALKAAATEIGTLASQEMGKPLREAIGEANWAADSLAQEIESIVDALKPEVLDDGRVRSELRVDPLGVAACISPWNFPVLMPQQIVLPSLLAGNTVVLKPSEKSPLCAQAWAARIGAVLPTDALQVVFGDGVEGRALVEADVNLIAFVGSRAAGEDIMRRAAGGLKRLVLELGGKDPLIVLPGADLDSAAAFATRNSFRNAGQVCVSTERIYVHRDVAEDFLARFRERASKLVQGDGARDGVDVGPMVDGAQKRHVVAQVRDAVAHGARAILGGSEGEGNFVPPTILVDVDHSMALMREETFGPVVGVMVVRDADEAVRLANDTPYGLGAAVFGAEDEAADVASRLTAGMVGINQGCGGSRGTPWVGARQSGFGYHSGREGHRQFAQVRVLSRPVRRAAATGG